MSFAITAYVREGIVMAADSRLSLNTQQVTGPNITNLISVGQSDSNQKLFVTKSGVGISTVGAADIKGVPIAGFIEQFAIQIVGDNNWSPDKVADEIIKFFHSQAVVPDTQFHIAGYDHDTNEQQVIHVAIPPKTKNRVNPKDQFGVAWAGEGDVLGRILNPSAEIDPQKGNAIKAVYPNIPIPFNFFTLQDAIDFSVYAVRTTIDTIKFQPRPKSVGGPIDVLVIKLNEIRWVKRKELNVI
jgi:hypothetical protein